MCPYDEFDKSLRRDSLIKDFLEACGFVASRAAVRKPFGVNDFIGREGSEIHKDWQLMRELEQ